MFKTLLAVLAVVAMALVATCTFASTPRPVATTATTMAACGAFASTTTVAHPAMAATKAFLKMAAVAATEAPSDGALVAATIETTPKTAGAVATTAKSYTEQLGMAAMATATAQEQTKGPEVLSQQAAFDTTATMAMADTDVGAPGATLTTGMATADTDVGRLVTLTTKKTTVALTTATTAPFARC